MTQLHAHNDNTAEPNDSTTGPVDDTTEPNDDTTETNDDTTETNDDTAESNNHTAKSNDVTCKLGTSECNSNKSPITKIPNTSDHLSGMQIGVNLVQTHTSKCYISNCNSVYAKGKKVTVDPRRSFHSEVIITTGDEVDK